MLMRSHSERRAFSGLSALMTHSSPIQSGVSSPRASVFEPVTLTSPPSWVAQALCNLEQGERELERLRERQAAEVEQVNEELGNAVLGAQREERRLLERVAQDHREAQRRLEQVKRENAAAVRVGQTLVDRQLRKLGQVKEQVQRWGSTSGGSNKNQLQRGVAEVTQPWEISLSLKRVTFLPSAQSVSLGELDVQEHSLSYPIGVCGAQGQKCPLHSGDTTFANRGPAEIRKDPSSSPGGGADRRRVETAKANSGSMRTVRKLRLSSPGEDEFREETRTPVPKSPLSPRPRGASESSLDEELESLCSDNLGQDLFLAFPPISSQGESEGDEPPGGQDGNKRRSVLKGKRTLVLVSSEEPSCPPEGNGEGPLTSWDTTASKTASRGASSSPTRHCPPSGRSLSLNRQPRGSSMEEASPPSPEDSEDACDTYTVNSPLGSLNREPRRAASTADLPGKVRLLIDGGKAPGLRRGNRACVCSAPSTLHPEPGRSPTSSEERESRARSPVKGGVPSKRVSRSLSMSAIEGGGGANTSKEQLPSEKGRREGAWKTALGEMEEEEGGSYALDSARLLRQSGKQGSGRTDFNLPSGLHASAKGQLFVVDCGNARIQVTDLQRNVVQQVSPAGTERSARICNYFDVAVNSKGLIALTCAAERALLVFSRHGRLLQTFGGTPMGSASNEELDAPRGVTVTCLDEFLVADIKRGSLTALKLDPKTAARLERTVVTGFHRPYLVAACPTSGLMAVSERGNETGRAPCIRVLDPGWKTIRILGVCSGLGPVLTCPWGLCLDSDGDVLVADWGPQQHRVVLYPAKGVGWPIVTQGLNSPRGLALLPEGQLVVSDSMNHCIKIYRYK